MARISSLFLSLWICEITQFVMCVSILFLPPYTRGEKKNIWYELESNPGPLASQATTLTTRLRLHGLIKITSNFSAFSRHFVPLFKSQMKFLVLFSFSLIRHFLSLAWKLDDLPIRGCHDWWNYRRDRFSNLSSALFQSHQLNQSLGLKTKTFETEREQFLFSTATSDIWCHNVWAFHNSALIC